jgi:hypothetical protein
MLIRSAFSASRTQSKQFSFHYDQIKRGQNGLAGSKRLGVMTKEGKNMLNGVANDSRKMPRNVYLESRRLEIKFMVQWEGSVD